MNLTRRVILKEDPPQARGRQNERVIRVLIADDQELVRTGFRVILETEGDIEVVAEAENGHEAIRQAALVKPEVVLMDIRMPELDGLAATEQILRQPDPPTIVVLTTFDQNEYIYRALRAGAAGFLLKDAPSSRLIAAVRAAATGDSLIEPSITKRLVERFGRAGGHPRYPGTARAAHTARTRRTPPDHPRPVQRGNRRGDGDRRDDREDPRGAHPHQAGRARPRPGSGGGLRDGLRRPQQCLSRGFDSVLLHGAAAEHGHTPTLPGAECVRLQIVTPGQDSPLQHWRLE